jgi:protein KRI1
MIVSHARTIEGTVRKDSTTRRDARASRNERKVSEKERLRGEVRRLKNLKREEIRAKMAQIAQVGGLAGADAIAAADLNSEFDPVAHDKLMSRMYDEQYYSGVLLDENGEELSKPEFGDLDDEVNEALGKATETEGGAADDSERFKKIRAAMLSASSSKGPQFEGDQGDDIDDEWEADGDEDEDEETGAQGADGDEGNNEGNKFSKRASKRWKKELMEKMDEYYALDAEDFIDDVPCRFKYKEVAPSMFGLSTKDILEMSDRQLTQVRPWAFPKSGHLRLMRCMDCSNGKRLTTTISAPENKTICPLYENRPSRDGRD